MEFVKFWLPTIGSGVFITWGISAWYANGKIHGIWLAFAGVVCLLLLAAIQLQEWVEKNDSGPAITGAEMAQTRAYISIIEADVVHVPEAPPVVTLVLRNIGKTIAHDVVWRAQFALGPLDAKIALDTNIPVSKQDLPPGGSLHYRYTFSSWNPEWDASLKTEAVAIIAFGAIGYTDIYGKSWPTEYRLISGGAYGRKSGITPGKFGVPPQSDKNKK